jgi:hypothetical protein
VEVREAGWSGLVEIATMSTDRKRARRAWRFLVLVLTSTLSSSSQSFLSRAARAGEIVSTVDGFAGLAAVAARAHRAELVDILANASGERSAAAARTAAERAADEAIALLDRSRIEVYRALKGDGWVLVLDSPAGAAHCWFAGTSTDLDVHCEAGVPDPTSVGPWEAPPGWSAGGSYASNGGPPTYDPSVAEACWEGTYPQTLPPLLPDACWDSCEDLRRGSAVDVVMEVGEGIYKWSSAYLTAMLALTGAKAVGAFAGLGTALGAGALSSLAIAGVVVGMIGGVVFYVDYVERSTDCPGCTGVGRRHYPQNDVCVDITCLCEYFETNTVPSGLPEDEGGSDGASTAGGGPGDAGSGMGAGSDGSGSGLNGGDCNWVDVSDTEECVALCGEGAYCEYCALIDLMTCTNSEPAGDDDSAFEVQP